MSSPYDPEDGGPPDRGDDDLPPPRGDSPPRGSRRSSRPRSRSRSYSPPGSRRGRGSRSRSPRGGSRYRDRSYSPERGRGGRYYRDRDYPPPRGGYRDYGPPPPPGRGGYYDEPPPMRRGDRDYPPGPPPPMRGGDPYRDYPPGPPPPPMRGPPGPPPPMRGGRGGGRGELRRDDGPPGVSLLVRNVSPHITPHDLHSAFGRIGEIRDVYIPRDYHSQQPKGFAFIEYATTEQAKEAREEMDRFVIKGRPLDVVFAQEKRKTPGEMRGRVVNQQNRGRESSNFDRSSSFERAKQREEGGGARNGGTNGTRTQDREENDDRND